MANAYLPDAIDEIGDAPLPLDKVTHRNRRPLIRPAEVGRGHWAPVHGPKTCVDPTGYVRHRHYFSVETRRGLACLWCGRLWGGRPARERER